MKNFNEKYILQKNCRTQHDLCKKQVESTSLFSSVLRVTKYVPCNLDSAKVRKVFT